MYEFKTVSTSLRLCAARRTRVVDGVLDSQWQLQLPTCQLQQQVFHGQPHHGRLRYMPLFSYDIQGLGLLWTEVDRERRTLPCRLPVTCHECYVYLHRLTFQCQAKVALKCQRQARCELTASLFTVWSDTL